MYHQGHHMPVIESRTVIPEIDVIAAVIEIETTERWSLTAAITTATVDSAGEWRRSKDGQNAASVEGLADWLHASTEAGAMNQMGRREYFVLDFSY